MRASAAQRALPARHRPARGAGASRRPRGGARACARRRSSIVATPMAGAARACLAHCRHATRRRCLAVQGLRGRARPAARPRDAQARSRPADAAACSRARASRWKWRAASRPRWSRRASDAALRELAVAAFHGAGAARLCNDDLVGVEVGGAVKNVLAIATGIADGAAARPECARRADHARPGRDDAPGRRARRARRDLHGPVGAGRPGADRHRRPVAQPPRRTAAGAGAAAGDHPAPSSATSPKA